MSFPATPASGSTAHVFPAWPQHHVNDHLKADIPGGTPRPGGELAALVSSTGTPVVAAVHRGAFAASAAVGPAASGADFFGVPGSDFPPYVIDSLGAVLNFGFYPYDGVDPTQVGHGFRPTPRLGVRPDVADGFRRFAQRKAADLRHSGHDAAAADIEKITAESTVLQDGRMMFRNGTKLAFHEMPRSPGCDPMLAVNFAGMSATRRDGAETGERFRGDIPTGLRQARHVVRSVVTSRATSNTRLVTLLGEYVRTRPESMFAYGHSMGGAFAEQLSNEVAASNRSNPQAAGKRVAFIAFQSATLQASESSRMLHRPHSGRHGESDQRDVRCCHVQSPRDLIGKLQGSRVFKWAAGRRVSADTGTRIDVLRDSGQTPVQQHDRVYQLLAEDLQRNPADLRRLLDHMQAVYRYSSQAAHGLLLGAR